MKKVFAAVLCALILGGCGSQGADLPQRILTQLNELPEQSLSIGSNHNKRYYSYYLPAGMGRRDSNALSEVFTKDGYRMIMNFDPSAIVIKNYYKEDEEDTETAPTSANSLDQFIEPKMEQEEHKVIYTGNYLTSGRTIYPYTLQISENNGWYLVYFDGTIVKIYTYVPAAAVSSSLKAMMMLASSIKYNEEEILKVYSMKALGNTKQESLDYLEQHLPSSGSLEELLNPEIEKGPNSDMPE